MNVYNLHIWLDGNRIQLAAASLESGELLTCMAGDLNPEEPEATTDTVGTRAAVTTDETIYWGNVIYRDGNPCMLLIPNGYVTFENNTPTFHYYTKDYLGNNRTVVNGTTGEIEQSMAYYPFRGVIADPGFGHAEQQYKFGGKELDITNGLNEYDFGARRYYQAVPMFTQPDLMAEEYPWLSPYVYCSNNPVNLVDIKGFAPDDYEAALMYIYVYKDDKFDSYKGDLEKRNWRESKFIVLTISICAFAWGVNLTQRRKKNVKFVFKQKCTFTSCFAYNTDNKI